MPYEQAVSFPCLYLLHNVAEDGTPTLMIRLALAPARAEIAFDDFEVVAVLYLLKLSFLVIKGEYLSILAFGAFTRVGDIFNLCNILFHKLKGTAWLIQSACSEEYP